LAIDPNVQSRQTPQQVLGALDSNKDGKVSLQEYEAPPLASFNKADTNHDGTLTPQEVQATRGK
jgi:hypothetical protein